MIISKTPLRASFFGGGTDFKDYYTKAKYGYGTVISTALDIHVYITVNKRFDNKFRIVYMGNELVDSVEEIKHNIIREAIRLVGISEGIEVIYSADLPMTDLGVGLASSSALAVGVLNALHAYKGEFVSPVVLAKEACEIEINRLGQQIGIQDQYAVACGGFHKYRFYDDDSVSVAPVACSKATRDLFVNNLMLFYTGTPRDSRQIFKEQKQTTITNSDRLDLLVEAVEKAEKELNEGNPDALGKMFDDTWKIKKKFAKGVSNELIDDMYDRAILAGALGGKILGAGGGGFMLLYVTDDKKENVRKALYGFKEIPFKMDVQGTRIIFVD